MTSSYAQIGGILNKTFFEILFIFLTCKRIRPEQPAAVQCQSHTRQETQAKGDVDENLPVLCKASLLFKDFCKAFLNH